MGVGLTVRRHARALLGRCRESGGFTLVELLVGASAGLILLVGIFSLMMVSANQLRGQEARVQSLDETRTALSVMTREIRQGALLSPVNPVPAGSGQQTSAAIDVYLAGLTTAESRWVRLDCSNSTTAGFTCTRTDPLANSGQPVIYLTEVSDPDVFRTDAVAEPETVQIELHRDVEDAEHPLSLSGSATVRNCLAEDDVRSGVCEGPA